ncbi:phasin-related domain-containing protein [Leptospira ilyithenensis]|uniref:Chemotaxis protein n=1 Tax=Leptospira ilyithenensis TaxID=2484901 RepID=A0A4V3JXH3_9LEPT|nr:chemotaxis protein [Leptospira ilyithenensis]TGN11067.1 chemotaxis protein [Leptospira ilyithenensis]
MEKQITDILNAGIGLFQSGKEGLDKAKTQLETSYNELVSKGALDNTEGSVKIRQSVDKILTDIKEFSSVAGKNYEETRVKIVENYNKISDEIKSRMPEGKIESVKAKINEVAESIKKAGTTSAKA